MKIFALISMFLILSSCIDSKGEMQEKSSIELGLVNEVFVKKELYGRDSIGLNKEQVELFVTEWNNAKSAGLYKMRPEFWIVLKLNNDSVRRFRVNGKLIKEKSDWTYSLSDSSLIRSFWKTE